MKKAFIAGGGIIVAIVLGLLSAQPASPWPGPQPPSPAAKPAPSAEQSGDVKITWSVPEFSQTLFPGASSTTTLSFNSNQDLSVVDVETTPSLDGIVSISPASFASIMANQNYQLTLTLTAPADFIKRSFGGTIQIRNATTSARLYSPPLLVNLETDYATYSNSAVPLSFSYPMFANVPATVVVNSDGSISYDVTEGTGTDTVTLPAFSIQIISNDGSASLLNWFSSNIDPSNLLLEDGTYTSTTLANGTSILLQTGGVPDEWEGGELLRAYVMSPTKASIAIVSVAQDDPLLDYGFSSQQVAEIVDSIVQTFTFN